MAWSLVVVTPPAVEPVTVQEVTAYLHHDVSEDYQAIGQLISAERQRCERVTGLVLISTTFRLTADNWYALPPAWLDGDAILLPPPLLAVTAINYTDATGGTVALPGSQYQVDTAAQPGRIAPAYGVGYWPAVRVQYGAVQITFSAGMGTGAASVPEAFKARIRQNVGWLLANRETPNESVLDGNYAALGYGGYP